MENQNQKNAGGKNCSSTCNKCHGNCAQNAQHNGPHKCQSGHNWS